MRYCNEKMYVQHTGDSRRGFGCFARENISKGEVSRCLDARLLTKVEVAMLPQRYQGICYEVDDEHEMCPLDFDDLSAEWYMNRSCNPNMATLPDLFTGIALRDIEPGEELTYDYATTDSRYADFECFCGAPNCRSIITGNDWMIPELQERYQGYFQKNIQEKVDALLKRSPRP